MSPNEKEYDYDGEPDNFELDPWDILSGNTPEIEIPDEYKSDEQLELEMDMAAEMEQQFKEEILEPELHSFFVDIFANAIQIEDKIGDIICHHFCDLEQITSFQIIIISRLGFAPKIGILSEIISNYHNLKTLKSIIPKIKFIKEVRNGFAHRKQGWISHGNTVEEFTITLTKYENGEKKELVLDKQKRDKVKNFILACNKELETIDLEIRRERNHIS